MTARRHFAALADQPPPRRALQGLDYQGRHPEAAEACTELGVGDDDLACAEGIVRAVLWSLALYFAGTIAAIAVFWPA